MARTNKTTTTKKVDTEVSNNVNLTYNYEIADGKIVSLNCTGTKQDGSGNAFFQWQRGAEIASANFNQMLADSTLQEHVQTQFNAIVGEVETQQG